MSRPQILPAVSPLTHLWINLSLPCVIVCILAILLSQTQSSNDSGLRTLLIPPPDCPAPCFMGIQPGVTTLNAAIEDLRANPLILSITNFAPGRYDIEFVQPFASMRTARMPLLLDARHGIVERIVLYDPGIQLSEMVLILGRPAQLTLNDGLHTGFITYVAFYPQYQMYIEADLPLCALELSRFWRVRQTALVGIVTASRYAKQPNYYRTGATQNGETWPQQIQAMKRAHCA